MGHAVLFSLAALRGLPKLWLLPVAVIPQARRRPRLIFDFTWSGLNEATAQDVPKEVMRFGGTLHHIIWGVLVSDPRLGPVYFGKMDLDDAYMWLWVRLEVTPPVEFLIPRKRPIDNHLVGFHLSLPMVYVDSAPYFCMYTEIIADMTNAAMDGRHTAPHQPLKRLEDAPALIDREPKQAEDDQWTLTPPNQQVHDLEQVDVYV